MKILVVAPHPDDEVLGCGGAMLRHSKAGDSVCLCIVTKSYEPEWSREFAERRKVEITEAGKILGVEKTFRLDLPTVKLDTLPQKELNEMLSKVVAEVKPDVCYLPFRGDLSMDHRLVFEACLVALRPGHNAANPKRILCYETLSETEWGEPLLHFSPNYYVDVTDTLEGKINAMKAYGSEVREPPHPRSIETIRALAAKRGSECGTRFAEAFALVREVAGK